jgi:hypothetical protein
MSDTTLLINLSKFGYTKKWFDNGLLTQEELNKQLEILKIADDTNTEHYRYKTLSDFVDSKNNISDSQLFNFLEIAINDIDTSMSSSAIVKLLEKDYLTDRQFERVSTSLTVFGDWTEKVIVRQKLVRRLKVEELTDKLFKESLVSADKVVHTILLSLVEHDIDRMEALIRKAANSKIRNQAVQLWKKNYR